MSRVKAALTAHARASAASVLVNAATSFTMSAFLLATLSPFEFGLYTIAIALSYLLMGFATAVFATPMVLQLNHEDIADRDECLRRYLQALTLTTAAIAVPALALCWIVDILAGGAFPFLLSLSSFVFAVGLSCRDLLLRHSQAVDGGWYGLILSTAIGATVALSYGLAFVLGISLEAWQALLIAAMATLAPVSLYAARHLAGGFLPIGEVVRILERGRWNAISHTVKSGRGYLYPLVVVHQIGPIGIAHINAARLFQTPAFVVNTALSIQSLPALVRASRHSKDFLSWPYISVALKLASVAALLSGLGYLGYTVGHQTLRAGYQGLAGYVLAWGAIALLTAWWTARENILIATAHFRRMALMDAVLAAYSIALLAILSHMHGTNGAIAALVIGETTYLLAVELLLWRTSSAKRP